MKVVLAPKYSKLTKPLIKHPNKNTWQKIGWLILTTSWFLLLLTQCNRKRDTRTTTTVTRITMYERREPVTRWEHG
tara:strand:+ start:170 stop:397 length:228 start_codon:yes stop_codon:yes gene_type:complete